MPLISPNFDVKSIIFFLILAWGPFPKLLEKALQIVRQMDFFIKDDGVKSGLTIVNIEGSQIIIF